LEYGLGGRFDLNPAILGAWRFLRWGIAVVFAVLAVQLLYHFGPDLKQSFRHSLTGAIVAVLSWIGAVIPGGELLPTLRILG
jgi:uncharacterized BrkB/YihY/UPF0761 family membrane protein